MNAQSRHSLHCSYTQSMDVDEDSKSKFGQKYLALLDMSSWVFNRGYSVLPNNNAISTENSLQLAHGPILRGGQGVQTSPPEKSQKYRVY